MLTITDTMVRVPKKIGLLDHMGGGNLGDDATQTAVMHNIKSRWPDSLIFGFSMNPSDTQTRHGIPSYAIRKQTWDLGDPVINGRVTFKGKVKTAAKKYPFLFSLLKTLSAVTIRIPRDLFHEIVFLAKSFNVIRSFDLLIMSGGGQLLDSWGGPWAFPYTLFKWVLLAKLSNVKCYFINVGAGPLVHPLSKYFVKRALFLADYISLRDEQSRQLVKEIGFAGRTHVSADSVYSLDIPAFTKGRIGERAEPLVGLSPMAYCDPRVYWQKDKNVYTTFVQTLALFASWLSRNHHRLALFSTDISFDAQTIEDLKAAIQDDSRGADSCCIQQEPITITDTLLYQMSSMDYIVTCRFHGVIFAHLMNIPVLAISHHPKVATLMTDLGLAEYCVDIHTIDAAVLTNTFIRLANNRDDVKARMAEKAALYKNELNTQFDELFPGRGHNEYARGIFGERSHAGL